jgi:hypothetical protein
VEARNQDSHWARAFGARLRAHIGAKLVVWGGLTAGICGPYFALQRLELFPARLPPVTALDRAVAFEPLWIWPYVSIALLVAIAPMLATSRDALRRYVLGLAILCGVCFAVFLAVPVIGPRPSVMPDQALYRFIVAVDRPTNSFPSLHVGLAVYSLLYCNRVLGPGGSRSSRFLRQGLGALWGAAILYSTLATKQHWAIDLPPAIVIAAVAYALAWRRAD